MASGTIEPMLTGERTFIVLALGVGVWIAAGAPLPVAQMFVSDSKTPSVPPPSASMAEVPVTFRDVRAIYFTAGMAASPRRLDKAIQLIEDSELNALVVNVKDGDGSYLGPGMTEIAGKLREHGIYPIARIVVFQDNGLTEERPDLAVRDADGKVWADEGGYRWVDPANQEVWDRVVTVAKEAINEGFLELNLDYVRFPSDGNVGELSYPTYTGKVSKEQVITDFFKYFTDQVRAEHPTAAISVDVFGFSFLSPTDLGIGQRLEAYAPYFDVISPMVYPSHFSPDTFGFENPAEHPYGVIMGTLARGMMRLKAASSTAIVRPWIQDFNMGAVYDTHMFREQIRAVRDAGAGLPGEGDSWMAWNPSNLYEPEKFIRVPAGER